jgi:two-component system, NarL family, nitrate/nitrite response regulator NarL
MGIGVAQKESVRTQDKPIKIFIADDHPVFREGVRRLLETRPRFQVVGDSSDSSELLQRIAESKPDILLLDLSMPRVHGLEILKELSSSGSPVRTILLTAEIEKPQVVEALLLGASGLVLKDTTTQLLFKAIETVNAGQHWIGREKVSDIIETCREFAGRIRLDNRQQDFGLTSRELEIVQALSSGETNKDIARRLRISEQTVKHHLTNVFSKLGVSHRLELVLFAISNRLIEGEHTTIPTRVSGNGSDEYQAKPRIARG